jgi:hypothetical protein
LGPGQQVDATIEQQISNGRLNRLGLDVPHVHEQLAEPPVGHLVVLDRDDLVERLGRQHAGGYQRAPRLGRRPGTVMA